MAYIVDNVTIGTMETALHWINEHFKGNIEFSELLEIEEQKMWKFTLRCIKKRKLGHAVSRPEIFGQPRPLPTACWHVYYYFFLELPDEALIQVPTRIDESAKILRMGHHWYSRREEDFPTWEIKGYPVHELCDCNHDSAMMYNPFRRTFQNASLPK